ncbi:MAG: hypothetical protein ABSG02_10460 [Terriglobales bacterium]|jgi:hypothetical protein
MILLVTPSERGTECAAALHAATGEEVRVTESLPRAATLLRTNCCLAAVFDQHLLEAEPHEADTTLEHLGTAIPVQVNLAICGMERLVRDVRTAVQRRKREEIQARESAMGRLRSELNDTVTALLLSSELALDTPGLSGAASARIQSVHDLVKKLRSQLENAGSRESNHAAGA